MTKTQRRQAVHQTNKKRFKAPVSSFGHRYLPPAACLSPPSSDSFPSRNTRVMDVSDTCPSCRLQWNTSVDDGLKLSIDTNWVGISVFASDRAAPGLIVFGAHHQKHYTAVLSLSHLLRVEFVLPGRELPEDSPRTLRRLRFLHGACGLLIRI